MIKKTITYVDYDGNKRTEEFHFNLSRAEIIRLNLSEDGGLEAYVKELVKTSNMRDAYALIEKIVKASYGEKSENGRRFIKSDKATEEFVQSEAYSELIMELLQDPKEAAYFVNHLVSNFETKEALVEGGVNAEA